MRLLGLTICLLVSTIGARADSLEDRVAALEARVRVLEDSLHGQGAAITGANLDGTYRAVMPDGAVLTATFDKGKVVANDGKETKTGTYEVVGQKVAVTSEGKTETLTIEGNHLRTDDRDHIEFDRVTPGTVAATAKLDGSYEATMPGNKTIKLELSGGKATVSMDNDSKTGTYEMVGGQLVITIDNKPEIFTVDGDHLKASHGDEKIDFSKTK